MKTSSASPLGAQACTSSSAISATPWAMCRARWPSWRWAPRWRGQTRRACTSLRRWSTSTWLWSTSCRCPRWTVGAAALSLAQSAASADVVLAILFTLACFCYRLETEMRSGSGCVPALSCAPRMHPIIAAGSTHPAPHVGSAPLLCARLAGRQAPSCCCWVRKRRGASGWTQIWRIFYWSLDRASWCCWQSMRSPETWTGSAACCSTRVPTGLPPSRPRRLPRSAAGWCCSWQRHRVLPCANRRCLSCRPAATPAVAGGYSAASAHPSAHILC